MHIFIVDHFLLDVCEADRLNACNFHSFTLSLTISTPIWRPFPLTSPIISYLSRSLASSVSRYVPTSALFSCILSSFIVWKQHIAFNFKYLLASMNHTLNNAVPSIHHYTIIYIFVLVYLSHLKWHFMYSLLLIPDILWCILLQ